MTISEFYSYSNFDWLSSEEFAELLDSVFDLADEDEG